ncbi:Clr5 domain-containing protein [Xylariales sp. AK1849]|nr:Clr5 domain-containing protein [Xylariales sp. AK1849]
MSNDTSTRTSVMLHNGVNTWATGEDWVARRSIITRLYIDEKRTLKNVMHIMSDEYRFFGTEKMYKAWLRRWGLKKNLTARDIPEILAEKARIAGMGKVSTVVIQGRKVKSRTVNLYLQRARKHVSMSQARLHHNIQQTRPVVTENPPRTPLLHPRWLMSPDETKIPEELIQISHQLVEGCCDGGTWLAYRESGVVMYSSRSARWSAAIDCACTLIDRGRYRQAFRVLDGCFEKFEDLLLNPEPALLILLYLTLLRLPTEIAQRLLSYALEVSTITLPEQLPLRLIWPRLCRAQRSHGRNYAWRILSSYFAVLAGRVYSPNVLSFTAAFHDYMAVHDVLEIESIETARHHALSESPQLGSPENKIFSRMSLTMVQDLCRRYQHDEPRMSRHNRQSPAGPSKLFVEWYLRDGFDSLEDTDLSDEDIDVGEQYVLLCCSLYSPSHSEKMKNTATLQGYFRGIDTVAHGDETLRMLEPESH